MTDILPSTDTADLLSALDANMCAFWQPYGRGRGARHGSDADAVWFYTGVDFPLFNGAMGTRLTVNHVPRIRDFLSAGISEHGAAAVWWIGPAAKPEIIEALEDAKLTPLGETPAMAADLASADLSVPAVASLTVKKVAGPQDQAVWARTAAAGTGLSESAAQGSEALEATLSDSDYLAQHRYVAFLDGAPVATSAMVLSDGVAGIYAVATLPEARGKGIGRAMTALPLVEAQRQGYRVATLQASSMGRPIYEKMGFTEVGTYQRYMQTA